MHGHAADAARPLVFGDAHGQAPVARPSPRPRQHRFFVTPPLTLPSVRRHRARTWSTTGAVQQQQGHSLHVADDVHHHRRLHRRLRLARHRRRRRAGRRRARGLPACRSARTQRQRPVRRRRADALTNAAGYYRIGGFAAGTYKANLDPHLSGRLRPEHGQALTTSLPSGDQYSDRGLRPPAAAAPAPLPQAPSATPSGSTPTTTASRMPARPASRRRVRLYRDLNGDGVLDLQPIRWSARRRPMRAASRLLGPAHRFRLRQPSQVSGAGELSQHRHKPARCGRQHDDGGRHGRDYRDGQSEVGLPVHRRGQRDQRRLRLQLGGAIGNFAWYDTNANGLLQDDQPGPCGAPNATLVLVYDTNGNGTADAGEPPIGTYPPAMPRRVPVHVAGTDVGQLPVRSLPPGNYVVQTSEQEIPGPVSGNVNVMVPTTAGSQAVSLAANHRSPPSTSATPIGQDRGPRLLRRKQQRRP